MFVVCFRKKYRKISVVSSTKRAVVIEPLNEDSPWSSWEQFEQSESVRDSRVLPRDGLRKGINISRYLLPTEMPRLKSYGLDAQVNSKQNESRGL